MTIVTPEQDVDADTLSESQPGASHQNDIVNDANIKLELPCLPKDIDPDIPLLTKKNSENSCSTASDAEVNVPPIQLKKLTFPYNELLSLEEMISNTRWIIPVLPNQELEVLLNAAIELCHMGEDETSEECQRFFRESMAVCITKIMTDEAVSEWKTDILPYIYSNCLKFIQICVLKLSDDCIQLLELLGLVLNPLNKFHTISAMRSPETVPSGPTSIRENLFALPSSDSRSPRGWLVDMLNKFGEYGGYDRLLERFQSNSSLSITLICNLLKPFGLCSEFLTVNTVTKYFLPIVNSIPSILESLSDEELKREAKIEAKNDVISTIIKSCKQLLLRVPNLEQEIKEFEMFRLKMLLRLLQISSFNGKMNALNEMNKLITGITFYPTRHPNIDHDTNDWLTSERMAKWIKENNVLEIVLRDSLHQPQYVEKLEKILRFIIKEKALTFEDLDAVWAAQSGKHDAIVKNVHDLLAKLAWDFSPEQLDHLFVCFQASWSTANKKQTEKLLELIRRLAEDDKDGDMARKVLTLFWNLAHKEDVLSEILDQALSAHIKILDYSCSQDRDGQRTLWIEKCVKELKTNENWVLPALKLIKDICSLYESAANMVQSQRQHVIYRQEVIDRLQNQHQLVVLVSENLASYINTIRDYVKEHPETDPNTYCVDGKYNHVQQVQERLGFLKFLLKDGRLWLCTEQARLIWECLAEECVFDCDREACFKWFSKIMGDVPDLEPEIYKDFFENNILQFDPSQLTENGMKCFERFFKIVNCRDGKYRMKRKNYHPEAMDLIGTEYLWRVLANGSDVIANRAIELLKEVNTNLGSRLQTAIVDFHGSHISECVDRLRALYDTIKALSTSEEGKNQSSIDDPTINMQIHNESMKMCRVLRVLYEYINECDNNFTSDRKFLPLYRACQGKHVIVAVRFVNSGRQMEDIEILTHGNMTIGCMRKQILRRVKGFSPNVKVELFANGEVLYPVDDRRLVSEMHVIKDKVFLTAKLIQGNGNLVSSPDSSSDSSTGSPHHIVDLSHNEDELFLPGVIISRNENYAQFFFQIADKGCELGDSNLRTAARNILRIVPADQKTVENLLLSFCPSAIEQLENSSDNVTADSLFFNSSPTKVLYNIEVLYTLLTPAHLPNDKLNEFQYSFLLSEDAQLVIEMLTRNHFLPNADVETKRAAFSTVLKICNVLLTTIGHVIYRLGGLSWYQHEPNLLFNHVPVKVIQEALYSLQQQNADVTVRNEHARKVSKKFVEFLTNNREAMPTSLLKDALKFTVPHLEFIRALMRLSWACASGNMQLIVDSVSTDKLHKCFRNNEPDDNDVLVCREALELMTISVILNESSLEMLLDDKLWPNFFIDLLLLTNNRLIRCYSSEQFFFMLSFSHSRAPLLNSVSHLFTVLNENIVTNNGANVYEYFNILRKLLSVMQQRGHMIQNIDTALDAEIAWLKNVKQCVKKYGDLIVDEVLLEGHLGLTKELLKFMPPIKKYFYGSDESSNCNLVKELIEDFIFPASKQMLYFEKFKEIKLEKALPVCNTSQTLETAFDLLVTLCEGCPPNLKLIVDMLCDMFYSENDTPLTEWDYLPPVGPRPHSGFVGLKNAGATCYMNSVLQQLFMIDKIKVNVLAADGIITDPNEDFSGEEKFDLESLLEPADNDEKCSIEEARKRYNVNILKEVQAIFAHLACSKLQYYVPKGLWRNFRLQGEPVNLREQQDAVEFFMSLIESVDEALKAINQEQIMSKVLGGSFSDQKICKTCPHRYCREELFSVISVDMRNHSNLLDSLEQYVKGELLEGVDAYHCDKCDKKVVTVKRLCVKKLPPVLTIQLKRFEYDFERVCAIKFNDYFEFPRHLDMEPYTVSGLAKVEGELIDCDNGIHSDSLDLNGANVAGTDVCTKYELSGIVVHSGQASGGHYYSYILYRQKNGANKWFKFDDGEVSECKMEDDEEMKAQCFGGDYMGEVFDQMLKRMSYRRQKRWWNAYMLFYTRLDVQEDNLVKDTQLLSLADVGAYTLKMPEPIERSVIRQNIKFMHNRNQFSMEYFHFMKKLTVCNTPQHSQYSLDSLSVTDLEELSLLTVQLVSKFLFFTGFHTKKNIRGSASEWYEVLIYHFKTYRSVRMWFTYNILLDKAPDRFCEYLLVCPSTEVRTAFIRIVACLAHFAMDDPLANPMSTPTIYFHSNSPLSDQIIVTVLSLLNKEIAEHGRHLSHYFTLFHNYCGYGRPEKEQLLRLNVPVMFILVTLDEGPSPSIKYQYSELVKCHSVISTLIRCCDVRSNCKSHIPSTDILPNPYAEYQNNEYIMELNREVHEHLYHRIIYIKKLIEDSQLSDDVVKLIPFVCWENSNMSGIVLSELLWHIAFAYCNELKHHTELLLSVLRMEDSWQKARILKALQGIGDERDGLFDIFISNKSHYQKRSYLCVKCLVTLFSKCQLAHDLLLSTPALKRRWWEAVEWLNMEFDKKPFGNSPSYSYQNWQASNSVPSNDSGNGYALERSNSAKKIRDAALGICPESEGDADDLLDDGESSQTEENMSNDAQPVSLINMDEVASPEAERLQYTDNNHKYFQKEYDCPK